MTSNGELEHLDDTPLPVIFKRARKVHTSAENDGASVVSSRQSRERGDSCDTCRRMGVAPLLLFPVIFLRVRCLVVIFLSGFPLDDSERNCQFMLAETVSTRLSSLVLHATGLTGYRLSYPSRTRHRLGSPAMRPLPRFPSQLSKFSPLSSPHPLLVLSVPRFPASPPP